MALSLRAVGLGIMGVMIVPIVALLLLQEPLEASLDRFAKARDVSSLTAMAAPGAWQGRNPFAVFKSNGAYDCGRFGWTAVSGKAPWGQQYVVFTTPLTSEDVGERLFETNGSKLVKYIDEREDLGWRIQDHGMTVSFDLPAKKAIIGDAFTVRSNGKSPNLMVRMGPNYRVKSLRKLVGDGLSWSQLGGIVLIGGAKDGDKLLMDYEGVVDKPFYAGSISSKEALLTNDYWYPMIGRKPAKFAIKIRVQPSWTAMTSGDLVSDSVKNGVREIVYGMDLPISYWSLNAGPYRNVKEKIGNRTYQVWSSALSDEQMQLQPKLFPLIVDTFEKYLGKFPFDGYGSCMTPTYGGGALEAYSFVTSGYFSGEDSHEIGHTWFGGIVNNTYLTSMWNESFAVWASGFFGRNALLGNLAEREKAFIMTPSVDPSYGAAPLNDSPPDIGPAASSLGYGKGAYVLQMLEQQMGTETFLVACRKWLAEQDKTRGGEWEDFEREVKSVSKQNLDWFFDQWVRRPGYADFTIGQVQFVNGQVTGTVAFQGAPYRIKCEVLVDVAGKQTFTEFELKPGRFAIPVAGKPSVVSFDPWRRIVRKISDDETPAELASRLPRMTRVDYRATANMLSGIGRPGSTQKPGNLNGRFLVGLPQDDATLGQLYARVGVTVLGNRLTYRGTSVDLDKGGFVALVDLPGGGQCAIGAGKVLHSQDFGRARLMVFDEFGRFLRGVTEPKTKGNLTFKL